MLLLVRLTSYNHHSNNYFSYDIFLLAAFFSGIATSCGYYKVLNVIINTYAILGTYVATAESIRQQEIKKKGVSEDMKS